MLAAALALVGVPAAVSATPGSGVTGVILAQGESDDGIVIRGRGTTDVVVREITIQPGGFAGESFVEPRGRNHVHIGRNLGTEPVILMVTYVLPDGKPLSQDAPKPAICTSS